MIHACPWFPPQKVTASLSGYMRADPCHYLPHSMRSYVVSRTGEGRFFPSSLLYAVPTY